MRTGQTVSVIAPTKNSADSLAASLSSIKRQTYSPIELIVVDNGSTDATPAIAEHFADIFVTRGPERSAQRNFGASRSKGDYLFFLDHDQVLEDDVIEMCVAAAGGADAVIVPEISIGTGFWATARALERSCYQGDNDIEAARFYRREVFNAIDGFDEEIRAGGEDWDLHARVADAGYRIVRVSRPLYHIEGRVKILKTAKRRFYYARGFRLYAKKHPERARRQFSPFRPAYFRCWRRLLRHPFLTIGFSCLKLVEGFASLAGLVFSREAGR